MASLEEHDLARLSPQQRAALEILLLKRRAPNPPAGAPEARIVRVSRAGGPAPLSFAQQRLWFIDQLEPGSPLYNISIALRVKGPLRCEVLALTLGEIVRRHEALRTVFAVERGVPVQVIRPAQPFPLPVVDLAGLPEREREVLSLALAHEESGRPFALGSGPLLRGVLLQRGKEDHVVALTMHHIVSDGWSIGILVREVTALYSAFAAGRPSPLPELPMQYGDFAVWQQSGAHGEMMESSASYWRKRLADAPPLTPLPLDRQRASHPSSLHGCSRPCSTPQDLSDSLKKLVREQNVTFFMVLLAAFKTLLSSYSDQEDIVVGTVVAGRELAEIEGLIGFFVNVLALRTSLAGDPTFLELLQRVRETTLEAYTHQGMPFAKVVDELRLERSLSHTPLFQAVLTMQPPMPPPERETTTGLTMAPLDLEVGETPFDLVFNLSEAPTGVSGFVFYHTDLFDTSTITRLTERYSELLRIVAATPERRLSEIRAALLEQLSGEEEREFGSASRRMFKSARRQAIVVGAGAPR